MRTFGSSASARAAWSLAFVALIATAAPALAQPATPLDQGFARPPDSAKPHTWWHWMNGNVTKVGITADLEAMKRVGVGGAQIFDVTDGILPGPVKYLTPEWRGMIKHAVQEADRLGLELCIHNCAGWSSSGGPWTTPEHAMQMVVTTETRVKGPARFDATLPQPLTKVGYYRDIAVLAFPTPPAEATSMLEAKPKVTASAANVDGAKLLDGNPGTQVTLPLRAGAKGAYIQFEFAQPFTAQGLSILPGGGRGGQGGELQVSDDGVTFTRVAGFGVPEATWTNPVMTLSFAPVTGRFYRLAFATTGARGGAVVLAEAHLEAGVRLSNWAWKSGLDRADNPAPDTMEASNDATTPRGQVVDITDKLAAGGRLVWDVPEGSWTILRLGHTPTGKDNHPAPIEGTGLECDKCSREAVDAHFAGMLAKIIADLGPLAGKTLQHVLIDSYEVGCQNWTPKMREEFTKRRGYDPLPFLPVMTGRVVDSVAVSERFLWDFRRTIADLFADNYYGHMAELCHQHGMKLSAEAYGNGNFEDLQCAEKADIPMSEFWAGGSGIDDQCAKQASSAAHAWGRKVVGAESFTADPSCGKWQNTPYSNKALGDAEWCSGVNRFIFHRYAQQPWMDLLPGMTMGPHGMHFERTITWWNQGAAWLQYIARSQYLLQSGQFVGDLCYFTGEGAPNSLPGKGGLRPPPPPGYDYDGCNADIVLKLMSVRDGRIVLPSGMSYRVLVLPTDNRMTPVMLQKLRDLVRDGAKVVGPKPTRSPSLQGYPDCDVEVRKLADEVWGNCDGKTVTEHVLGQGRVFWGRPLEEVLFGLGIAPDFAARNVDPRRQAMVSRIHRDLAGTDVYFVASHSNRPETVECSFRGRDRVPELWYPESGRMEDAPTYRVEGGRTVVPIRFDPSGSLFVVFRRAAAQSDPIVALRRDGQSIFTPKPRPDVKLEIRSAIYGVLESPAVDWADVTTQVSNMVKDGVLVVRASNEIAGDPAPNIVKQMRIDYTLDGKDGRKVIDENQTLRLPAQGKAGQLVIRKALYGIVPAEDNPTPKLQAVDVTAQLRALVKDGALTIKADNTIAGDPASLIVKQMKVEYTVNGEPYTRTVNENQMLDLPDGTEMDTAAVGPPPPDLSTRDGATVLAAWEPGTYEATTASGKTQQVDVRGIPRPIEVAGPWELTFPPKLGAPAKATFDKLISWTDSPDEGVKYFSGTATYTKQLDIPAALLRPGNVLMLDLGSLRELAEVTLNGRNLGILWKPPFRVDITQIAKPGRNQLVVQVTNTWANRLIGDEQLPDDAEWSGDALKAWPQWLLEGKPRPKTGRITFTTWKHYHKDSPLLESGLLGPVVLRPGREVKL